jgi:hypothetical protein
VYEEYLGYCATNNVKPLSTADFGKVMKQVYPQVSPRYFTSCYRESLETIFCVKILQFFETDPGSAINILDLHTQDRNTAKYTIPIL